MYKPIRRRLLFTRSCNSLKRIEFTMVKYYKGAGICSLNDGISLYQDSLNLDLSVLFFRFETLHGWHAMMHFIGMQFHIWKCQVRLFKTLDYAVKVSNTQIFAYLFSFISSLSKIEQNMKKVIWKSPIKIRLLTLKLGTQQNV